MYHHSEDFIRTLRECHQTLWMHRDSLQHSETLLRPQFPETTTPDLLLRPLAGMHPTEVETGEQLLRASLGEDSDTSSRNEACLPAG